MTLMAFATPSASPQTLCTASTGFAPFYAFLRCAINCEIRRGQMELSMFEHF